MDFSNFLNPADKNIEPMTDAAVVDINSTIMNHTGQQDDEDNNNEDVDIPVLTSAEAIQAVSLLFRYQEHQEDTSINDIRALRQLERQIKSCLSSQATQITLDK